MYSPRGLHRSGHVSLFCTVLVNAAVLIFCTDTVEGTTYNHGRPEGISEDQHPMNQFLGMLYGQVRP